MITNQIVATPVNLSGFRKPEGKVLPGTVIRLWTKKNGISLQEAIHLIAGSKPQDLLEMAREMIRQGHVSLGEYELYEGDEIMAAA